MDTTFAPSQPAAVPLWNEGIPGRSAPQGALTHVLKLSPEQTFDFAEPSPWSVSTAKRCLDVVVASLALVICWPLLLLTALVVRLESPGPVIFRQKRVGRGGVLFTVYKFRTMEVARQQDGPSMTKRGDPRITRFGAFLRRHKLDELPQLINVLRGQMSLIGPRPRLPHHMEISDLPFRPGLTGAATLAFRCEEEMLQDIPDHELEAYNSRTIIPLKGKLDWDYMGQATLASDIALLCETAACCLSSRPNSFMIDLS
ncbi:MAG TPA: sugar transferase [Acidobacteriaceae bacterium]|nr:sugar transferase [Acidobacteriaceae bacterium]